MDDPRPFWSWLMKTQDFVLYALLGAVAALILLPVAGGVSVFGILGLY
jgi:hypothetical protein